MLCSNRVKRFRTHKKVILTTAVLKSMDAEHYAFFVLSLIFLWQITTNLLKNHRNNLKKIQRIFHASLLCC